MIYDFQSYKNKKEQELLDLRAGVAVLHKTLQDLNINTSPDLKLIKTTIRATIKQLSKKIDEKRTRH